MNPNEEFIRTESKGIVDDLYTFGLSYVKHRTIFEFFYRFFKPRMDSVIMHEANIKDIRNVLFKVKKRVDKLYKMIDTVEALRDSPTDAALKKRIEEMPGFKKLAELFDSG